MAVLLVLLTMTEAVGKESVLLPSVKLFCRRKMQGSFIGRRWTLLEEVRGMRRTLPQVVSSSFSLPLRWRSFCVFVAALVVARLLLVTVDEMTCAFGLEVGLVVFVLRSLFRWP